jgi:uncharacterized protein (TIGR00255 family)
MTGFARVDGRLKTWSWTVEARSVNGRGLEVRFRGPPGLDLLERAAREAVQGKMVRGQVSLGLKVKREAKRPLLSVNEAVLETLVQLAGRYVDRQGVAPARLDGLLRLPGVISAGDEGDEAPETVEAAMVQTIIAAVDALAEARLGEGRALLVVLEARLALIEALVTAAAAEALGQPLAVRERLRRRLNELLEGSIGFEDQAAQEAALLASRADVTEELDRLFLHVAAARSLLASGEAAGRRLDFLTQEFMREANTLCSKSVLPSLTTHGLALKAAVDQLREQVQNVE